MMSSIVSQFNLGVHNATYHATKSFVDVWSRSLAAELRGTGVTVIISSPAGTVTNFAKASDGETAPLWHVNEWLGINGLAGDVAKKSLVATFRGDLDVRPGITMLMHFLLASNWSTTWSILNTRIAWQNISTTTRTPEGCWNVVWASLLWCAYLFGYCYTGKRLLFIELSI